MSVVSAIQSQSETRWTGIRLPILLQVEYASGNGNMTEIIEAFSIYTVTKHQEAQAKTRTFIGSAERGMKYLSFFLN